MYLYDMKGVFFMKIIKWCTRCRTNYIFSPTIEDIEKMQRDKVDFILEFYICETCKKENKE
jgi:hypothetical protein